MQKRKKEKDRINSVIAALQDELQSQIRNYNFILQKFEAEKDQWINPRECYIVFIFFIIVFLFIYFTFIYLPTHLFAVYLIS